MFFRGANLEHHDSDDDHDRIWHQTKEYQGQYNGDKFRLGNDLCFGLLEAEWAFNRYWSISKRLYSDPKAIA